MHVSHPYHDERGGSSYAGRWTVTVRLTSGAQHFRYRTEQEAAKARDAIVSAYERTMTSNARDAFALNERTEA